MANEYAVNNTDLISVADAIREKGGTTDQLVFPSGFVTAIQAITSGGTVLNFEIVGGTTKPGNPKENTIWVNTSTAVTGWAFSAKEPASPVEGMVWIRYGVTGDVEFNALKEEAIQMYLLGVKQYVDGAWSIQESHIYQGDTWTQFSYGRYYLFQAGVGEQVPLAVSKKENSTIVIAADKIVWDYVDSDGSVAYVRNTTKISTQGYTKLCCRMTASSIGSNSSYSLSLVITDASVDISTSDLSKFDAYKKLSTCTNPTVFELSISQEGDWYLGLYGYGKAEIFDIWLE